MHLSKCIINGFKSFADRVEIDFQEGFSAIVGPNGCGKSNIYEAILWVLGEQRPTSLRSSKMEEVIFSGTSSRNPVGMAEVSLFIIDDQRLLSDKSELKITRRLFRSGDSEYFLNGQQCRLKDITQLLSKVGMGKNSYAFIGQGEVNDILKARPQDLRLMFEEAAGISEYKSQKFSTEAQLQKNSDSILRVNDLIKEIESDCQNLRIRAEQARKHKEIKELLENKKETLLISKYKDLTLDIEEKRKSIKNYLDKVEDNKLLIESNNSKETLLKNKRREAFEKKQSLEREFIRNESKLDSKLSRKSELLEEVSNLESNFLSLRKELSEESSNLEEYLEVYDAKVLEKSQLEKKLEGLRSKNKTDTQKLNTLKDNFNEDQYLDYDEQYHELKMHLSSLEQKIKSINEDYSRIDEEINNNILKKKFIEENISKTKVQISIEEENLDKVSSKIKELISENSDIQESYEELRKTDNDLDEKLHDTYQKYQITKNKLEFYQHQKEDYSGYYNGVKFLMQAKSRLDNMESLYGPLAELITIPDKYQVAIGEVLGSRSQYLVCETAKAATEMISLLKREKAGKSSFLPLDSLKSKKNSIPNQIINDSAFLGRASEIINYPKNITRAVEQLLSNVLIYDYSKNVLTLNRKVNHNFMIATLDGEVFYSSGIISGGKNKGNTNQELLARNKIIDSLSKEVNDYKQLHNKYAKKMQLVKEKLDKISKDSSKYKSNIDKFKSDRNQLEKDISNLSIKYNNLIERLEEIDAVIASNKKRKDNLLSSKLETQAELNSKQSIFETISKKKSRYTEIYEEIKTKEMRLLSTNSDIRVANNRLESLKTLIIELNNNIETIKDRIIKNKELLKERKVSLDQKREYLESVKEEASVLRKTNEELEQKNLLLGNDLQSIDDQLENLVIKNRDLRSNIEQSQNKIRELELNIVSLETDLKYTEAELYQNNIDIKSVELKKFEVTKSSINSLSKEVSKLEKESKSLDNIDYGAIEDLERKEKRLDFLQEQKIDLVETQEKLTSLIRKVDNLCINELGTTISTVRDNFKYIFQDLFRGGSADIVWELDDNIFNSGITLSVSPPGKNVKNMNQLSGGEKALTAIALLLAFAKLRDSAFCIFDEVDAALDENNNLLLVDYLQDISKTSQVITITHSRHTMAHANHLYGVVMQEKGVSRVINVEMDKK
ncbi:MAG: chromosome segregation protein SMC [Clostridia bacterium]